MSPLLFFHIVAGLVGVSSGLATLALRKGSGPHRRMGQLFAIAMLAMCSSGAYIASFVHPDPINVTAGIFTAYLVASGWRTVRQRSFVMQRADKALMVVALLTGFACLGLSVARINSPHGVDEYAIGYAVFSTLAFLGVIGDVSVLVRRSIAGKHRLLRHLGRIGFALLIATFSLFLAVPNRILPNFIRLTNLKWLPVAFVLLSLLYWTFKTLRSGPRPKTRASLRGPVAADQGI
jgi:hypothetical protein